jgi:hypothetical protein
VTIEQRQRCAIDCLSVRNIHALNAIRNHDLRGSRRAAGYAQNYQRPQQPDEDSRHGTFSLI